MYRLLITLIMFGSSSTLIAKAKSNGFTIQPSMTVQSSQSSQKPEDEDTPSTDNYTGINLNLGLGYTTSSGLYIGGKVLLQSSTYNSKWESEYSGENDDKRLSSMTGYGPSIGFQSSGGFAIAASYILSADSDSKTTSTDDNGETTYQTTQKESNGLMVDLGYAIPVGGVHLGPQLVYFSRTHKKSTSKYTDISGNEAETESEGEYTLNTIQPYIGMWMNL